uniref:Uncharacterized protein n=1 Tax=Odontella aurita TaxID=265563 RepID=A0A7S4MTS5_9STRA|mmetsp:Transcript_32168/g.96401  ORF Transcript_32168/g.96401 Transcript_32168/m.96401 type:complete len:253 (+) Transcript_32168:196-954(+)
MPDKHRGATLQAATPASLEDAIAEWADRAIPSDALYYHPEKTYGRVAHLHATITYFPQEIWSEWLERVVMEEAATTIASTPNSARSSTGAAPPIPENWTGAAAAPRGQSNDRTMTARDLVVWEGKYFDIIALLLDPAPLTCRLYCRVFDRNPYGLDKTSTPGWYEAMEPHITIAYVTKGLGKYLVEKVAVKGMSDEPESLERSKSAVASTSANAFRLFNGLTWEIQVLELSLPTGDAHQFTLPPHNNIAHTK